ncbi:unnamed protein product [Adineta steineri]|uniref:Phage tail collar domain-containing protein n=1 Tax=Adineta steineri TaxID=433720 RepID=A0A815MW09_9BILA|nr:unnamed protein product [Adineta steineri]CAF4015848.1 unnamed protein product [Adineta steineri]
MNYEWKYALMVLFLTVSSSRSFLTQYSTSFLPIGTVISYAGLEVPQNWTLCDGSNVSRTTYSKLFSVIGTLYGAGDHVKTFGLPDFRGRFILGLDSRQNQTAGLNQGGSAQHTLTTDELPAHQHNKGTLETLVNGTHTHTYIDPGHNHGGQTGESPYSSGSHSMNLRDGNGNDNGRHSHSIPIGLTDITINPSGVHLHDVNGSTSLTGKGQPFYIMPPSQTMVFIILFQ